MQFMISSIRGYAIHAAGTAVGTLSDVLFDDETWTVQWLVVETGRWLAHHKILLRPTAIDSADSGEKTIVVRLSMAEIEACASLDHHKPVSGQMQSRHHSQDAAGFVRGNCYSGESWPASTLTTSPFIRTTRLSDSEVGASSPRSGDPHLRSVSAVTGYRIHAADGQIGHVQDFLVDDGTWAIRYLIVDTRNWWPGKHVLLSPGVVKAVSWADQEIRLDVTCDRVRDSPSWAPVEKLDQPDDHGPRHPGWPDYDFRLLDGE